ncbi:MAG TPA: ABC transporter ATP-binding protein [Methylomirabilota bacterium]|nr:ABC transporter ATP-binding protein [Methylomirabilota bacterium]
MGERDTAIELREVSKRYWRHSHRPTASTLKSYLLRDLWSRRRLDADAIWALRGVSLDVDSGTTLGIIGRNGSGKSTLLKLVNRVLKPDAGTVTVRGTVASLVELGAGFHPELTGRENVVINGTILGLTKKEIRARFDEIVAFAELADCIDEPVRTYSSGMYMRLGFSIAVHVDPDILLIDEILAVGDQPFTQKCMSRMNRFKEVGKTIVFVSHDLDVVRSWCGDAVWLDRGVVRERGKPGDVVDAYLASLSQKP